MAMVIGIQCSPFDSDDLDVEVSCGKCSNCDGPLVQQPQHGFPTACPYCGEPLENGRDDRKWVQQIVYRQFVPEVATIATHQVMLELDDTGHSRFDIPIMSEPVHPQMLTELTASNRILDKHQVG